VRSHERHHDQRATPLALSIPERVDIVDSTQHAAAWYSPQFALPFSNCSTQSGGDGMSVGIRAARSAHFGQACACRSSARPGHSLKFQRAQRHRPRGRNGDDVPSRDEQEFVHARAGCDDAAHVSGDFSVLLRRPVSCLAVRQQLRPVLLRAQ
jgi:hypothetical protein